MELSGDEKRIQALFSDLSREDQGCTPRFEKLWLRAETNVRVPALISMRLVTAFAAVVVFAAVGLVATASWYRSDESAQAVNVPAQNIPSTSVPGVIKPEQLLSSDSMTLRSDRRRRSIRRRQIERVVTPEVVTFSNWQSPTSAFLQSPTASAFAALPQLNQSAQELEMFLPKNHESIKESNQ
jgi:hypothetical protein